MSEVKRAKLISFGSERVNNKNSKEIGKTVRIAVILPESTEDKCPEFNYKDLFTATKIVMEALRNEIPNSEEQDVSVKYVFPMLKACDGSSSQPRSQQAKITIADEEIEEIVLSALENAKTDCEQLDIRL
ncbi:hypothetical protein ILUMI_09121 [Ignelater luminosus]|uniref:Uncharacterized protein n=1 Tax=Ignelater luminosus TaxID=2038154 RepID=A0A8K0D9X0_IGNLU|nr:hypothetical protein ILUMI_09121 [Ignelater luminosus]